MKFFFVYGDGQNVLGRLKMVMVIRKLSLGQFYIPIMLPLNSCDRRHSNFMSLLGIYSLALNMTRFYCKYCGLIASYLLV